MLLQEARGTPRPAWAAKHTPGEGATLDSKRSSPSSSLFAVKNSICHIERLTCRLNMPSSHLLHSFRVRGTNADLGAAPMPFDAFRKSQAPRAGRVRALRAHAGAPRAAPRSG